MGMKKAFSVIISLAFVGALLYALFYVGNEYGLFENNMFISSQTDVGTVSTASEEDDLPAYRPAARYTQAGDLKIEPDFPIHPNQYYYRNLLNANEKAIYDRVARASEKLETNIELGQPAAPEAVKKIVQYFFLDHPENFYWDPAYTLKGPEDKATEMIVKLRFSIDEIKGMRKQIEAKITEILSLVNSDMSEYEACLIFHDWIVNHCVYDTKTAESDLSDRNAFTIYGMLIEGNAVCEGYAEVFQYLCHRVGIDALDVVGRAHGSDVMHKWSMVKIGGQYYHVDVTWDDPYIEDTQHILTHTYFMLNDDQMSRTHTVSSDYTVPACRGGDITFYQKNQLNAAPQTVADTFARALSLYADEAQQTKRQDFIVEIRCAGDAKDYNTMAESLFSGAYPIYARLMDSYNEKYPNNTLDVDSVSHMTRESDYPILRFFMRFKK